jgi:hypothetical protein
MLLAGADFEFVEFSAICVDRVYCRKFCIFFVDGWVVYKQRAASGICRPMQVYREKRRACAALKPGEKTLRVETSKNQMEHIWHWLL